MSNFVYFKVQLKLISEMLGTCSEASIWDEHVIQKAKKEIRIANSLSKKLTKQAQKYKGPEISEDKHAEELKGILRRFYSLTGEPQEIPNDLEALLECAKEAEALFNEKVAAGEARKATVFMVDQSGYPMVSTHMILGNLKENLKIMVNSGDKGIMPSKVSVGEALALDVKPVDHFMRPSMDIMKDQQGNRILCERPIRFERMGKTETAIASSEMLPIGTIFEVVLRVRQGSRLTKEALETLLDMGKSNGLGAWRGSGNKGAYVYKIEELPDFKEEFEDGWR
jgi:hypothetical protein